MFEAVVTPAVLYACETWTMSSNLEAKLRTARRWMLRMLFPWRRQKIFNETGAQELEPWVPWIQMVTKRIDEHMTAKGIEDWITV